MGTDLKGGRDCRNDVRSASPCQKRKNRGPYSAQQHFMLQRALDTYVTK
jgi:hypothetical protein